MTTEHKHGGNPLADLARLHLSETKIIDFSVNLNPLGMPDVIAKNWQYLFNAVQDYPTINGQGITDFYTHKTGVKHDEFLAGNGSTELIYLIPRALKFKKVLIPAPSFYDYERASTLAGAEVVTYPLKLKNNFALPSVDELEAVINNVDAIWVGRPNNPTAGMFKRDTIIYLREKYPDKYFIIDEAFIQFVDRWKDESLISCNRYPNLIIIHSFTKFYSIAGLRMGGVIGHRDTIGLLNEFKEPWTVNGIAENAAILLKDCEDFERDTIVYLNYERERIFTILKEMDGLEVFPSCTNFFLCRWKMTENLDDLLKYLLGNGVFVRDCRNFRGLEDNYFRFGIRSVKDNDRLLSLLSSFRK
ncbi:MAG: threonine-phosphate decarboxylase [Desulfatiglans sp.]|jgi:threonine-phosphate decarboxylase|nr:threonine-phosphate decarboxylase [Desulfatiglans sp.]